MLRATVTWNPPSVAHGAAVSTTVMVTGADAGDVAAAAFPGLPGGMLLSPTSRGFPTP